MSRRTCAAVLAAGLAIAPGMLSSRNGISVAAGISVRSSQGYLGVDIRDVGDEQMAALKLKESRGAEIVRVDHDGPAGKAGLREHDVILQMNGQTVEGEEQLRRMLRETPAGRAVTLIISRDGQQQAVNAQMANREEVERQAWQQHMTVPEPNELGGSAPASGGSTGSTGVGNGTVHGGMGFLHGGGLPSISSGSRGDRAFLGTMMGLPYTGATLEPVGPQLAEFFGVQGGTGLLVQSVEVNSPAATAGLKAGDVVLKVDQTTVTSLGDWARTVHDNKGRPVPVTVLREKKEQMLTLTPDPKRRSGVEWPGFWPGYAGVEMPTEALVGEMRPLLPERLEEMHLRDELLSNTPEMEKSMRELRRQLEILQLEQRDLSE